MLTLRLKWGSEMENTQKRVLYLTNIEVPYRVQFFNKLSEHCDLTVLYERRRSKNRDKKWTESEKSLYKKEYLDGINIGNESSVSLKILKYILSDYDHIIVGCYNSPVQMMAVLMMRLLKKTYMINIDGETFLGGNSIKSRAKRFFLKKADKYLVAGKKASDSLRNFFPDCDIVWYPFSSLMDNEVKELSNDSTKEREDYILVVGQYFDYKGMDIALRAAIMDKRLRYKFVGMGNRTELFEKLADSLNASNVEVIPFLPKEELTKEYKSCKMLVLPSRYECWGLVVNEAAACGTPIVSTWGSGAAVEFISEEYPQFLAKPDDEKSLYEAIQGLLKYDKYEEYSLYLKEKSPKYTIENCVDTHLKAMDVI